MSFFWKTVFWAAAFGFAAPCVLLFSTSAPSGSGIGKVLPIILLVVAAAGFVAAWPIISTIAYLVARKRSQSESRLRELHAAMTTSVVLLALAAAILGSKFWVQHSFETRLKKIDDGAFSKADLFHMVDESFARGKPVLRENYHIMKHIASSSNTPPEVLAHAIELGDISSEFWAYVRKNPTATPETIAKIQSLEAKAKGR